MKHQGVWLCHRAEDNREGCLIISTCPLSWLCAQLPPTSCYLVPLLIPSCFVDPLPPKPSDYFWLKFNTDGVLCLELLASKIPLCLDIHHAGTASSPCP